MSFDDFCVLFALFASKFSNFHWLLFSFTLLNILFVWWLVLVADRWSLSNLDEYVCIQRLHYWHGIYVLCCMHHHNIAGWFIKHIVTSSNIWAGLQHDFVQTITEIANLHTVCSRLWDSVYLVWNWITVFIRFEIDCRLFLMNSLLFMSMVLSLLLSSFSTSLHSLVGCVLFRFFVYFQLFFSYKHTHTHTL